MSCSVVAKIRRIWELLEVESGFDEGINVVSEKDLELYIKSVSIVEGMLAVGEN